MELKFSRHEEKSTQREQFMQRLYLLEGLQLKITRKREKEELLSFLSPPQEEDSSPDLFLELTFLFVKLVLMWMKQIHVFLQLGL